MRSLTLYANGFRDGVKWAVEKAREKLVRPKKCKSRIRISRSKEASSVSVTVAGSSNPCSSSQPLIPFSVRETPTITTGTFTTRRTEAVGSQRRGRGIAEIERVKKEN